MKHGLRQIEITKKMFRFNKAGRKSNISVLKPEFI